jgi:putative protease
LKPGEERLANFYLRLQPDALLIRSAGMLHKLAAVREEGEQLSDLYSQEVTLYADPESTAFSVLACHGDHHSFTSGKCETAGEIPELEGDFSLNAANTLSVQLLLGKGLQKLALTHDLNAAQLAALGKALGPER